jgi:hypothetical protein
MATYGVNVRRLPGGGYTLDASRATAVFDGSALVVSVADDPTTVPPADGVGVCAAVTLPAGAVPIIATGIRGDVEWDLADAGRPVGAGSFWTVNGDGTVTVPLLLFAPGDGSYIGEIIWDTAPVVFGGS